MDTTNIEPFEYLDTTLAHWTEMMLQSKLAAGFRSPCPERKAAQASARAAYLRYEAAKEEEDAAYIAQRKAAARTLYKQCYRSPK